MVRISRARLASASRKVFGDLLDHVGRALDQRTVDGQLAAGQDHHDQAEDQHVDRNAPEIAPHDRLLRDRAAGEVAEVQHEGAVDRHPQRGAAQNLRPHRAARQRVRPRPDQLAARGIQHPARQRQEGDQDDGAGEGFVLADGFHPVAGDDHLHDPQDREADPAQHRQAQHDLLRQRRKAGHHDDQQHVQHHRGQIGLDAKPDDGDAAPDQRRDLRAAGAKTDPAHHREGHAGLLAHEAREVQQHEQEKRAEHQCGKDLPRPQPQCEQPDGKGIVAQAMHVIGPQREDVVGTPGAALLLAGCKVLVVETG